MNTETTIKEETMTTLIVTDAHESVRSAPRWIQQKYGRGYMSETMGSYNKKSRLYIGVEGENILENLAFRTNRPSKLYKTVVPQILSMLGLPEDTKAVWNQKAGCSCGCSPGFVLDINQDFGYSSGDRRDFYATVTGENAKVVPTEDAMAEAADRVGQLDRQGILDALKGANENPAEDDGQKTGRGPQGNLRNFKQMKDSKLVNVCDVIMDEDNDSEAMEAISFEMRVRGL